MVQGSILLRQDEEHVSPNFMGPDQMDRPGGRPWTHVSLFELFAICIIHTTLMGEIWMSQDLGKVDTKEQFPH